MRLCAFVAILFSLTKKVNAQRNSNNAELANQYAASGDCDKAIVYFDNYYDQDPLNAYPGYLKCLLSLKEYDKAEKLIKKHSKKFSNDPSFKVDLANVYELKGDNDKAKKTYSEIIKNIPPDINQVNLLGNAFMQRQQFDYAAQTYIQGRKALPNRFTWFISGGMFLIISE